MLDTSEDKPSLKDLADEVNAALVRIGHADWRREFNARLWGCGRERALALISEYRHKIVYLSGFAIVDSLARQMFSRN